MVLQCFENMYNVVADSIAGSNSVTASSIFMELDTIDTDFEV